MKIHVTDDKEHAAIIRQGLRDNEGYCPCVYKSKGRTEYLCPCEEFRTKTQVGEKCHCGLFIKEEM